jgi:hypothetical protein
MVYSGKSEKGGKSKKGFVVVITKSSSLSRLGPFSPSAKEKWLEVDQSE